MIGCECHRETGSHELCCGHDEGRSPDCPIHGDGTTSGEPGGLIAHLEAAWHKAAGTASREAARARYVKACTDIDQCQQVGCRAITPIHARCESHRV